MTMAGNRQREHRHCSSGHRLASLLLFLCLLVGLPADSTQAAEAASRQQAIEMALQQNGGNGRVLGVQTQTTREGQTVFAVKILSNGRVRVFRIRQAR